MGHVEQEPVAMVARMQEMLKRPAAADGSGTERKRGRPAMKRPASATIAPVAPKVPELSEFPYQVGAHVIQRNPSFRRFEVWTAGKKNGNYGWRQHGEGYDSAFKAAWATTRV